VTCNLGYVLKPDLKSKLMCKHTLPLVSAGQDEHAVSRATLRMLAMVSTLTVVLLLQIDVAQRIVRCWRSGVVML